MKTRYRFPLLAAMMAALLTTAPFRSSAADRPPDPNDPSEPRFDLTISAGSFEGKPGQKVEATIDHLAEFLRETMPGLNIVLSPNVGGANTAEDRAKRVDEALAKLEAIIKDTLQLSMKLNGADKTGPLIKFHPGANLLVVAGTPKQIEVVRKVVMALAPGSVPARGSAPAAESTK